MKKWLHKTSVSLVLAAAFTQPSIAQEQRFDIYRFDVVGNTLLQDRQIKMLLAPMVGTGRVYGDIQKALEALEGAYRAAGYSSVQVEVPEQELTGGVVQFKVVEVKVAKITVVGNKYFDAANVKAGLVSLREGQTPNMRMLSENIQLSNENPAKQVEVTLGAGDVEDTIDVKVAVTDKNPHHFSATFDNTGAPSSGRNRIGAAYQYGNLFNLDHVVSLAYTTSPDSPPGVTVRQFSLGYRMPVYRFGDSVDVIYGKSSSSTPSSTPNLGGALNLTGKGDVFGLRLNHNFARDGEVSSKLVAGFDYKYIDSRCSTVDGQPVSIEAPTPPIASCVPFTVRPLSLTYSVTRRGAASQADASIGLAYNWAKGVRYTNIDGRIDRYSYLTTGNRATRDGFAILRGSASYLTAFESDWQLRAAFTGQYSPSPAISSEQFGLAGSGAVRGFSERAVAADSGVLLVAEATTPDLAAKMGSKTASLRAVLFYDTAEGFNSLSSDLVPSSVRIASYGFGLRGSYKEIMLRADVARVLNAGTALTEHKGYMHAHVSLMAGF